MTEVLNQEETKNELNIEQADPSQHDTTSQKKDDLTNMTD